jgi:hypothetical protein
VRRSISYRNLLALVGAGVLNWPGCLYQYKVLATKPNEVKLEVSLRKPPQINVLTLKYEDYASGVIIEELVGSRVMVMPQNQPIHPAMLGFYNHHYAPCERRQTKTLQDFLDSLVTTPNKAGIYTWEAFASPTGKAAGAERTTLQHGLERTFWFAEDADMSDVDLAFVELDAVNEMRRYSDRLTAMRPRIEQAHYAVAHINNGQQVQHLLQLIAERRQQF